MCTVQFQSVFVCLLDPLLFKYWQSKFHERVAHLMESIIKPTGCHILSLQSKGQSSCGYHSGEKTSAGKEVSLQENAEKTKQTYVAQVS
jgi:hypothetical protein